MGDLRTLDVPLDLKLSEIQVPDVLSTEVAEEVNVYLRDQLNKSHKENEALKLELCESKAVGEENSLKIRELNKKLRDYECLTNNNEFASSSRVANSKIVELSKRLREKSSEIEVYKSKCSKLENRISELETTQEELVSVSSENVEKSSDGDADEIKKLQEKLAHMKSKWAEEKNQSAKLKNDLKLANKWLQQEIGDNFDTLSNVSNSSNWRGRAQIIQDLQQKNSELKEKLKGLQDKKPQDLSPSKIDRKIEILTKENHDLKNNYDDLKRKFDANKARCRSLETECGMLKKKITENSERDQQLIASLTAQISKQGRDVNEDLKQKEMMVKKLQRENHELRVELEKEKCELENKSKELQEKSEDIAVLNRRIRSARPQSSYKHKPDRGNNEAKPSMDKEIGRLEAERLRLLELTEIQNKRLEEERNAHMKTSNVLRIEKQKGAKLEANLARLELEQNSFRSGYSNKTNATLKSNDTTLQDKLELAEENIKALSTRLDLEIFERKSDLQEFTKILKHYSSDTF